MTKTVSALDRATEELTKACVWGQEQGITLSYGSFSLTLPDGGSGQCPISLLWTMNDYNGDRTSTLDWATAHLGAPTQDHIWAFIDGFDGVAFSAGFKASCHDWWDLGQRLRREFNPMEVW